MSKLDNIKKETGFQVPDGYFENFTKKMQENIHQEVESKSLLKILKPIFSAAAVLVGFAVISYFVYGTVINNKDENATNNIAQNDYEEDIYNEELILDVLYSDEAKEDSIYADDLMDYLEDEVTYEDLLAEL